MNHRLLRLMTMIQIHFMTLVDLIKLMLCLISALIFCSIWGLKDFSLIFGWKGICMIILLTLNLSPNFYSSNMMIFS